MERHGSFDQKPGPDQQDQKPPKRLGGSSSGKLKKKMSEKFERTKVVASSGAMKVKDGASASVNWIKLKYHAHKLSKQ